MTTDPRMISMSVTLDAAALAPGSIIPLSDGVSSIRLSPMGNVNTVYLDGTLDELAKFVADLAGVVRELNARELAATDPDEHLTAGSNFSPADLAGQYRTFDGTRAPVQAVVDALEERFVNGQEGRW